MRSLAATVVLVVLTGHVGAEAAATQHCRTAQLDVRLVRISGAAGTVYVSFKVRNESSVPCHLRGYFRVRMLDRSRDRLETHDHQSGRSPIAAKRQPKTVTLLPDSTARWELSYGDVCSRGKAVRAANLRLWSPHARRSRVVPAHPPGESGRFYACNGDLDVYRVYKRRR